MKKYRGFSVDVVANGFIASIGCQRLVFKTMEEVSEAIMDYAKDPEGAARKILDNSFTDSPDLPLPAAPPLLRPTPEVVEAFQMTEDRRYNNIDWPEWLNRAWNMPDFSEGALSIDPDDPERKKLVIGTLEGVQRITWNDWIIKGIKGELYACKPDVFTQTYEEARHEPT